MIQLQSNEQFNELINKSNIIMLFYADWCKDCIFIEPFISDIVAMFDDYTFIQVDRDKFLDICEQYDVYGIPSFIAFNNGEELGRFVNRDRKTKEDIISFIDDLDS